MADHVIVPPSPRTVEDDPPTAVLDSATVNRVIGVAITLLLLGGLWAIVADPVLELDDTLIGRASGRLLSPDRERGIPAAFSFLLILTTAALLWGMTFASVDAEAVARFRTRWRLLAGALLFVGFDELLAVHEKVSEQMRAALGLSGIWRFGWTIPYGLAGLVLAWLMIRPLQALPRWSRMLMLAGGLCYGIGAVGMEMLGDLIEAADGPEALYVAETVMEELLEMVGVWLFLARVLAMLRGASLRLVVR